MNILVIRHGETIENAQGIVQGQLPGRLSEKGIKQAKKAARELATKNFDYIYCSDLQRCVDTLGILIKEIKDIPVRYTEELREISFGVYQGMYANDLPDWKTLEGGFYTRRPPEGETINQFRQRTINYMNELFNQHKNDELLIVTHGGNIRVIRSVLEALDLWELYQAKPDNCSIWKFEITEELHI